MFVRPLSARLAAVLAAYDVRVYKYSSSIVAYYIFNNYNGLNIDLTLLIFEPYIISILSTTLSLLHMYLTMMDFMSSINSVICYHTYS